MRHKTKIVRIEVTEQQEYVACDVGYKNSRIISIEFLSILFEFQLNNILNFSVSQTKFGLVKDQF